ncbi:putative transposase [Celeribacter baekdonensis B30]|uniref:Putative transposase n=1 Tax=Celeribacter baekdonensis B30 TaxID=1208323 RepID=K2IH00_9RHOB|nr:putative transposase [Celeribacter baekdonensis B30]
MLLSRPCTIDDRSSRADWFITQIAAGNICPCDTPSAWPKLASNHRSAASGDSYDNALAETINGLYKTELVHRQGPWRNVQDLEMATLGWVDWFNNRRLLGPIGNIPPAEAEENFYAQRNMLDMVA